MQLLTLNNVIKKSRIHLYKPIQIAEVLYKDRKNAIENLDLSDLSTYRIQSRKWRDEQSIKIIGRISTSSARYQDDVWNENAVPPKALAVLSEYNKQTCGVVEAYIYNKINEKHSTLTDIYKYIKSLTPDKFNLQSLISMFNQDAGLMRSMDKVFEITVYSLFINLTSILKIDVDIKMSCSDIELLDEFEDFTFKVYGLNKNIQNRSLLANIYRVGTTNASDRGLDMWSSFGAAIQVKHISLTDQIFYDITEEVNADRLIIVCKEAENNIIKNIIAKTGASSKVQIIITLEELFNWYNKCLNNKKKKSLGKDLLKIFIEEFEKEFPFVGNYLDNLLKDRGYNKIDVQLFEMFNS